VIGDPKMRMEATMRRMSLTMPASVSVSPDVWETRMTTEMLRVKAVRVFIATARPTWGMSSLGMAVGSL
jgi:hypothetical protein